MLYIFMAEGFEEVEAIATIDVIRRANIEIKTVGINSKTIKGSHGMPVVCDINEDEISLDADVDGIILPGGMPGTLNLNDSPAVQNAINFCAENGRLLAAICAAPLILGRKGLLKDKNAVCFPGFEDELQGANISENFVCTDGNVITAKGMGSAINFGLAIVAYFKGAEKAAELKATLQCS